MKKPIFIFLILFLVIFGSIFLGRIGILEIYNGFINGDKFTYTLLFEIRLPRILVAFLIGASLSLCGVVFQALFQNPLVGPNILGVTSGAGFGATICILLSFSPYLTQVGAFIFGLIAVFMTYFIGRLSNKNSKLMLILSGIIVGAVFTALISIMQYIANTDSELPNIVYWLMGSLNTASWDEFIFLAPSSIIGIVFLYLLSWKINVLSVGGEHNQVLGDNTIILNGIIISLATLIASSSVAVSGIIGWVGLLIPHICRMIFGTNNLVLVPTSVFVGGIYLVIVDDIARSVSSTEIPLSILTALIGAPIIGYILIKKGKQWF